MTEVLSWQAYLPENFDVANFRSGLRILDVGCGDGRHLRQMLKAGCHPTGVEISSHLVDPLSKEGLDVHVARAEDLPFDDEVFDGLVCNGVIMYTDERQAIAECARVLKKEGEMRAMYFGGGYPLRQLLAGKDLKVRFYGLRMILNSWLFQVTRLRLPGWLGDTLYQTDSRLATYYKEHGLVLLETAIPKRFLGLRVFVFHRIRKSA